MAIKRDFNVPLSSLSTFRMGGVAKEVVTVESEADLVELFQNIPQNKHLFVLGGGSNVVFPDGDCDSLIIRVAISGIKLGPDGVTLKVGAGENWDGVVGFAVVRGLSGIEALSAIPGSTGATPVQNVGAYGREIKDVLVSLRAFYIENKTFKNFSNDECKFSYRDSFFKQEGKGKYIITEVTLALSRDLPNVPMYPGVAEYLASKEIRRANLSEIRDAIISIRSKKLPDPRDIASVGSFFKNPFVPAEQARALKEKYPKLAIFPIMTELPKTDAVREASEARDQGVHMTYSAGANERSDNEMRRIGGFCKVGAGSLIDVLGWKGKSFGTLSIYEHNALVLVNNGKATFSELSSVIDEIKNAVNERFGIILEVEPEFVNLEPRT